VASVLFLSASKVPRLLRTVVAQQARQVLVLVELPDVGSQLRPWGRHLQVLRVLVGVLVDPQHSRWLRQGAALLPLPQCSTRSLDEVHLQARDHQAFLRGCRRVVGCLRVCPRECRECRRVCQVACRRDVECLRECHRLDRECQECLRECRAACRRAWVCHPVCGLVCRPLAVQAVPRAAEECRLIKCEYT